MKSGLAAPEQIGTIKEQHVQVKVEIERRSEPLNQGDRTGLGAGGGREAGMPAILQRSGREKRAIRSPAGPRSTIGDHTE